MELKRPDQVVFYYHGRGHTWIGNDVWDAISSWEKDPLRKFGVGQRKVRTGLETVAEVQKSSTQAEHQMKEKSLVYKQQEQEREQVKQKNREKLGRWDQFVKDEESKSLRPNRVQTTPTWEESGIENVHKGTVW